MKVEGAENTRDKAPHIFLVMFHLLQDHSPDITMITSQIINSVGALKRHKCPFP